MNENSAGKQSEERRSGVRTKVVRETSTSLRSSPMSGQPQRKNGLTAWPESSDNSSEAGTDQRRELPKVIDFGDGASSANRSLSTHRG